MQTAMKKTTSVEGWDEVGDELNRAYGSFRFGSTRTLPRFEQSVVADDDITLARADLLSSIRAATATYEAPLVLTILSGRLDLHSASGMTTAPSSGPFFIGGGGASYDFEGEQPRSLVVQLSAEGLSAAAHRLAGVEVARPDSLPPLRRHVAGAWWSAVAHVKRVYECDELYDSYLIKRAAQRRLHETAVDAFRLVHDSERPAVSGRVVARAQRFIDENLGLPLTAADIAEAAHVSVRGLHAAFARAGEPSPLRYLKRARLDAVRHDLTQGDPEKQSVRDVARRWGFVSLGRFAAEYRDAFGELPRATVASLRSGLKPGATPSR